MHNNKSQLTLPTRLTTETTSNIPYEKNNLFINYKKQISLNSSTEEVTLNSKYCCGIFNVMV